MKRLILAFVCLIALCAHDLYLKTNSYFLDADQASELFIFNGTFERSENIMTRDRFVSASIKGPDFQFTPKDEHWYDKDKATYLKFTTGGEGTYIGGVSTKPKVIELSAKDFNDYLAHDGVLDVLAERKKTGEIDKPAKEQYAKSSKVLLQVGDAQTDHYKEVMGYPVEFIPQSNPYNAKVGDKISFKLLQDQKALSDHLVYVGNQAPSASSSHGHSHDDASLRTDKEGVLSFEIDHAGYWYLRTIHMVKGNHAEVDYVSNWATLTFEVR